MNLQTLQLSQITNLAQDIPNVGNPFVTSMDVNVNQNSGITFTYGIETPSIYLFNVETGNLQAIAEFDYEFQILGWMEFPQD